MAAGTWTIDSVHSSVEFAVKHMVFSTAKGRFKTFSGTIAFDPETVANSSVDVEIDVTSITTNEDGRDAHLKSPDFFDTENHPTATFKSTGVSGTPDALNVAGDLTIHGVTQPVTLKAEFLGQAESPMGGTVAAFSAATTIDRTKFGLTWNAALEAGGFLVANDVKLAIELELTRAE